MNNRYNIFKKLNFLLTNKQKKKLYLLFFLLIIGMFLEMLSIGILVPLLGLMVNSDMTNKYPIILSFFKFFNIETKEQIVIISMLSLVFFYLLRI